jgi:phosphoribosylcarboxyaminoimidazole (NCAIR) mutase
VGRRPIGSLVSVIPATEMIVTIVATIWVDPTYGPELVQAHVIEALENYADEVPIGGVNGVVPLAGIYRAIMLVPGVVNATIPTPAVDVPIAANAFPEFAMTLTFIEI